MDKRIKRYIFIRDAARCFHCGKDLKINQVNIDHYNPKSKGGTDDDFNLVLSCRRCNKYKRSTVPVDTNGVNIALFKRAFRDGRITDHVSKVDLALIEEIVESVDRIKREGKKTVFSGQKGNLTIEENKIIIIQHSKGIIRY